MRVLVVGEGGREHALCWALKRDTPDADVFAAPGNPGTAQLGTNLGIPVTAQDDLVSAARDHHIDFTIIGPEAPLAAGLADALRKTGQPVFGPGAANARIESSKVFAKDVMHRAGIPTAASRTFTAVDPALAYIEQHAEPLVVKASGLAAGKGVIVCATRADARRATRAMLTDGAFGDAGREVVIEDYLEGEELSVLALTDGEQILLLPAAQDHKRLGEGDTGPNTGGMGAYCPVSVATPALLERVRREVLEPAIAELAKRGAAPYQGVLYAGLMLAPDGTPYVLEFNCRFGDPETQALLPVLPGVTRHLAEIAAGRWTPDDTALPAQRAAVATVLAAPGYPEKPEVGAAIDVPRDLEPGTLVFHAGTSSAADGSLRVRGGRVLAVTGVGDSVAEARERSARGCELISFQGKTYRRDIGWREIGGRERRRGRGGERAGAARG
ncbi:MAG TPA: phosphoribosylamine--glycine ligase [Gemmatimonadales bacterium]|nr:phosphoribosylamine--glycine ligase [Gemmatimonadales bacterium]